MPLPKALTRFNRRVANPVARRFARMPPMALVVHVGRTSGKEYRTPVLAFPAAEGFAIALTYGRDVDWLKNVLAAGGCSVVRWGRTVELANPRVVGWTTGSLYMPVPVRVVLLGLQVRDFLLLDRALAV